MPYTDDELIERVSSKIDEVLPAVEGTPSGGMIEAPVAFITEVIHKAAENIILKAPVYMLRQIMKAASTHFPLTPEAFTGLVSVGGTNVTNNNLQSINSVSYRIEGESFGLSPMPVTIAADPTSGQNRRDIVVGNNQNELEYIAGTPNANPDLLDFPNVPTGKVLVMKVIILDDGAGGFNKTYLGGPIQSGFTNPSIRLIFTQAKGISLIPCPTDYLRFVSILLSTWETPVTELIEENDAKYRIQKNDRYRRGSNKKPFAALVGFSDYIPAEENANFFNRGTAIECFSSPASSAPTITKFHYIPETKANNMPPNLIDAVCWDAASQTLEMMNQPEKANRALAISERYFNNKYGLLGEGR
jgi:hypothetical protein